MNLAQFGEAGDDFSRACTQCKDLFMEEIVGWILKFLGVNLHEYVSVCNAGRRAPTLLKYYFALSWLPLFTYCPLLSVAVMLEMVNIYS